MSWLGDKAEAFAVGAAALADAAYENLTPLGVMEGDSINLAAKTDAYFATDNAEDYAKRDASNDKVEDAGGKGAAWEQTILRMA
jgi:hypothetical protein